MVSGPHSMESDVDTYVVKGQRDQDWSSTPGLRKTKNAGDTSASAANEGGSNLAASQAASPKEHSRTSGLRVKHAIDTHKALTPIVVLLLMAAYHAWQLPAIWAYLAMHGTYGLLWIVKSNIFPDKQWERFATPFEIVTTLLVLGSYWVTPWLIVRNQVQLAPWFIAMCFAVFTAGNFLMFVSDMQKHMHLKLRPGTLLCDGLWARCRNPNYLGEFMMYVGFLLLARHPLPLGIMAFLVFGTWLPGMRRKDASLSRFPDFAEWKARSALFIPGLL